ncbi:MAG: phosphotransferase [Dokdonella sp.]
MPKSLQSERRDALRRFVANALGRDDFELQPASADAGFRSYLRAVASADHGHAQTWIVMDAPPELVECAPFVGIAELLRAGGVNVPAIIAQDLERGFLLLSDLGRSTFLEAINSGDSPDPLMDAAIDALVTLQRIPVPDWLPAYDSALLEREIDLFPDWYLCRELGASLSRSELDDWNDARARIVSAALAQPHVLVHRDFMPRNLMPPISSETDPRPGVLDFQDAVSGPIAYDPICLFKDAFISWPSERVDRWLRTYHERGVNAGLPLPEYSAFRRDADWIGMHRHLKVIGIFARLKHRDVKPKYLADVSRFFSYLLDVLPAYPELAGLEHLLRRYHPESAQPA